MQLWNPPNFLRILWLYSWLHRQYHSKFSLQLFSNFVSRAVTAFSFMWWGSDTTFVCHQQKRMLSGNTYFLTLQQKFYKFLYYSRLDAPRDISHSLCGILFNNNFHSICNIAYLQFKNSVTCFLKEYSNFSKFFSISPEPSGSRDVQWDFVFSFNVSID